MMTRLPTLKGEAMRWSRILVSFGALLIAGCSSPELPNHPPLTFTQYQPIYMAVSSVEFVQDYKSPMKPPYVENLMPYSPAEAMQIWVRDRLKTGGGTKTMKVIVKDGSVKAVQLPTGSGIKGFLTIEQDRRYDARLAVEMRIYGNSPIAEADIEANANRSVTMSEDASVAERDDVFRKLIADMMADMNAELEKDLYQYMSNYISYSQTP